MASTRAQYAPSSKAPSQSTPPRRGEPSTWHEIEATSGAERLAKYTGASCETRVEGEIVGEAARGAMLEALDRAARVLEAHAASPWYAFGKGEPHRARTIAAARVVKAAALAMVDDEAATTREAAELESLASRLLHRFEDTRATTRVVRNCKSTTLRARGGDVAPAEPATEREEIVRLLAWTLADLDLRQTEASARDLALTVAYAVQARPSLLAELRTHGAELFAGRAAIEATITPVVRSLRTQLERLEGTALDARGCARDRDAVATVVVRAALRALGHTSPDPLAFKQKRTRRADTKH